MLFMFRLHRKLSITVTLTLFLVLLSFGVWIGLRYIETKSAACDCDNPMDRDRLALFNPLRNRDAENVAIRVVTAIQAGKCQPVSSTSNYCPETAVSTVASWKLTGRRANANRMTIRFWVIRPPRPDGKAFGDPLWVNLYREGTSWKVERVDTYY